MTIDGEIHIKPVVRAPGLIDIRINWRGGDLARLSKSVFEPCEYRRDSKGYAAEVTLAKRTGRSTVLLMQARLRVIAERESYLIVMRESWRARIVQCYIAAVEFLASRFPAFGRRYARLS